jgi:perosamine synthetase
MPDTGGHGQIASDSMKSRYRIPLAAPIHNVDIENAVLSVLRSGWLVAGKRVAEFETQLCARTGRKHAIAVSSGTMALFSAMVAMGIGPESTVVVPAFTFPAPASVAATLGARVRLCDVDMDTFNISGQTLQPVLDSSVSLVVAIDQFGSPCPADRLEELCCERGIPLLVDAACSLGSTLLNRPCGGFGNAAVFSFHPRKIISSGEGGAVLTDDDEMASKVRRFRNIGIENGRFASAGINLRPSEIGAAMAGVQMNHLDEIVSHRRRIADIYGNLPFALQKPLAGANVNYQSLVSVLPAQKKSGEPFVRGDRDALVFYLASRGIEAQPSSFCLSEMDWLADGADAGSEGLPNSVRLADMAITLPMHHYMTDEDAMEVVETCARWIMDTGG